MRTKNNTADPHFELRFFAPRFWGTWCYLALLRVTIHLPRSWVMAMGAALGDLARARNDKRRRIAEINLAMCFPELTDERRRQLLVKHFRQYGRGLLDMGLVLWGKPPRLDALCELDRRDWLLQTARDSPVIIVGYHLTTLDISGSILARAHPVVSMMKRARNPLLTWQLWRGRVHLDRGNIRVVMRDQGLRPLVRELRAGRVCFFIPDEDFSARARSVFAPFFGVPTSTLTVVGRLAKLTGAVVLPSATQLDPVSGGYKMTVGEPLKNFPSGDAAADATKLNAAMESLIRRAPEQYLWTFRIFKTRPDGGVSPYKKK